MGAKCAVNQEMWEIRVADRQTSQLPATVVRTVYSRSPRAEKDLFTRCLLKRLDDHQDDDRDQQYGRHLVDDAIEALVVTVAVLGEMLAPDGKRVVQ